MPINWNEVALPMPYRDEAVVRIAEALVRRYALMRELTRNGLRRDLLGGAVEPELAAEMRHQLVAGVDAPAGSIHASFPIPAGVRLEALYASPWLEGTLEGTGCFTVPEHANAFAEAFRQRTGIDPELYVFQRNYRITPLEFGRIYEAVRGDATPPSLAARLLVSRHFDEAAEVAPILAAPPAGSSFPYPAIAGFRLLAELECKAHVFWMLGCLNLFALPEIRKALSGKTGLGLARALEKHPGLRTLLEQQQLGLALTSGAAPAVGVAATPTPEGAAARVTFGSAFTGAPPGMRASSHLLNNDPATFYGLNRTLTGAVLADLGDAFAPADGEKSYEARVERRAQLGEVIRGHVDPVGLAQAHHATARTKKPTGVNRQAIADAHVRIMLPARGQIGSAPRADADLWRGRWHVAAPAASGAPATSLWETRWRDAQLMRALLTGDLGKLPLELGKADRARLRRSLDDLAETFRPLFSARWGIIGDADAEDDAVRAACDIATAVGPLSLDRRIAAALRDLLAVYDVERQVFVAPKGDSSRPMPGVRKAVRVRRGKGVPSPANADTSGTPHGRRHAATKRAALEAEAKRREAAHAKGRVAHVAETNDVNEAE